MVNDKGRISIAIILVILFSNTFITSASSKILKCNFCKNKIDGRYITQDNNAYHEQCYKDHIQLRCDQCKNIINGNYNLKDDKNYHERCFKNFILDKCDVCYKPIEGEFIKDPWGNIYHNYHRSKMPLCESCNRLISKNITDGGYLINKSRNICNICWEYAINEKDKIKNIYSDLRKELKELGIYNLPKAMPIILIDSKEELFRISKIPSSNGLQGYTKYAYQTIGGEKINENFTIFILSNLHEINFRAVLAHEMLHVYLFKNDIALKESLVEGFCNLGSKYVYDSNLENKISELKLKSMYKNNHPEYGKGFRIMDSELDRYGWSKLLKKLESY
ncbi:MAG: LIM domain-containing protein [Candidatus Neomarinimicrobiota bacterium]